MKSILLTLACAVLATTIVLGQETKINEARPEKGQPPVRMEMHKNRPESKGYFRGGQRPDKKVNCQCKCPCHRQKDVQNKRFRGARRPE